MERATMEINPPRDRCYLVFLTLVLHGIGTLMPWNMFITAKSVNFHYDKHMFFFYKSHILQGDNIELHPKNIGHAPFQKL